MQNQFQIEISYYKIQKKFNLSRVILRDWKTYEITEQKETEIFLDEKINDCFYNNVIGEFYEDIKSQREKIKINSIKYFFTLNQKDTFVMTVTIDYCYDEMFLKSLDEMCVILKNNDLNPQISRNKNIIINECEYYFGSKKEKRRIYTENGITIIDDYGKITGIAKTEKEVDSFISNQIEIITEEIVQEEIKNVFEVIVNDFEKYSGLIQDYQTWRQEIYRNCETTKDFFERLYRGRFWISFSGDMRVYINNKYIIGNMKNFINISKNDWDYVENFIKNGGNFADIDFINENEFNNIDEEIKKAKDKYGDDFLKFLFQKTSRLSDITGAYSLNILKQKYFSC